MHTMLQKLRILIMVLLLHSTLCALEITTFYGPIDIQEPVLIELIQSPAFQRLKYIHQYGIAYYTTHKEEYTRYDHSLGVFSLLRAKNCSLKEQIAGLLHDVSHTVFSHAGDWIFNCQHQEDDYQTLTHSEYLESSGLGTILQKYGFTVEEVQPKHEYFPALEHPLPRLCADRIDYNLQGAYYRGYITHEEAVRMFHEIQFIDGDWVSSDLDLLKKLVRYSIFMSQDCWGSATECVLSMWLANAVLQCLEIGTLSIEKIRFGKDQEVWNTLLSTDDPIVQMNMFKIAHHSQYHTIVSTSEEANYKCKTKYRGIDPYLFLEGKKIPITLVDAELKNEFELAKERMAKGWFVKIE